jgi:hypothetical protein
LCLFAWLGLTMLSDAEQPSAASLPLPPTVSRSNSTSRQVNDKGAARSAQDVRWLELHQSCLDDTGSADLRDSGSVQPDGSFRRAASNHWFLRVPRHRMITKAVFCCYDAVRSIPSIFCVLRITSTLLLRRYDSLGAFRKEGRRARG